MNGEGLPATIMSQSGRKPTAGEFVPVDYRDVHIAGGFWGRWHDVVRNSTVPFIYDWLQKSGRLDAFGLKQVQGRPEPHIFWDSDVYKWLEGASYALLDEADEDLRGKLEATVTLIEGAQQSDGYLNLYFTMVRPDDRWSDLEGGHELYCAGHLFEAAVAHYQATGSDRLLNVAARYADYIASVFGPEEGQIQGYPGHEEIELALVKLFRATGKERYLTLARFFVDQRGARPSYFDEERRVRNRPGFLQIPFENPEERREYNQSHRPVREQDEVVGHAVRAMYLYAAITDLYAETGDRALLETSRRLWRHMTERRMYLTGGLGSLERIEGFGSDYDLPLDTAYAETCAAIGSIFWNHRMVQIACEREYADLMELTLYNAALAAMAQDGCHFFYANPMASNGDKARQEWFDVSCCPPNVMRLVLSLGQYVYSANADQIAVHLFVQSRARITLENTVVEVLQNTQFPLADTAELVLTVPDPSAFGMRIRVPGWSTRTDCWVNDVKVNPEVLAGYAVIHRTWVSGDTIRVRFRREPVRIGSHPRVQASRGLVAFKYGPLVYCFEEIDNGADLDTVCVDCSSPIGVEANRDLGMEILRVRATRRQTSSDEPLYHSLPLSRGLNEITLRAVPYWFWGNRGQGEMRIWLRACECTTGPA